MLEHEKALADAAHYKVMREAQANQAMLTPEYLTVCDPFFNILNFYSYFFIVASHFQHQQQHQDLFRKRYQRDVRRLYPKSYAEGESAKGLQV